MDKFIVEGGKPLKGCIRIDGSKNASLPILLSSLLTGDACTVHCVPDLRDIRTTRQILDHIGKKCVFKDGTFIINCDRILKTDAPYGLVKQMRASVLVAGPLLARFHRVKVPLPGGCSIGLRPIDIHLKAFEKLGAKIFRKSGDVIITAAGLRGSRIKFPFPSVGATENLMMCAVLVPGVTVLENCAREPEIADLAVFLRRMGARVEGEGTSLIRIKGVESLHGAEHTVIPDRVETGTYMIACAAAGGRLCLENTQHSQLASVIKCLKSTGIKVFCEKTAITVDSSGRPRPVSIDTKPYPGFPTDLQAPWMALMSLARGRSSIHEKIFENRFMHAAELARMGACIRVEGGRAEVEGVPHLSGAPVMASDIRAGAALVVAALAAKGRSEIRRVYHIDRGYERMEEKLREAGAAIKRVKE
ncbi:MAG: UDP-N-acetylglucosamine 1-carboxyvinyltransferase [bacterium]